MAPMASEKQYNDVFERKREMKIRMSLIICMVVLFVCISSQVLADAVGEPSFDDQWDSQFEGGVEQIVVTTNNRRAALPDSRYYHPDNTVNGSGLDLATGLLHTQQLDAPPAAEYSPNGIGGYAHCENGWSRAGEENQRGGTVVGGTYFQYEFLEPKRLTEMWIWNYNADIYHPGGIKNCTIEYSVTGSSDPADWTTIFAGEVPISSGGGTGPSSVDLVVDFGGAMAQYVVITSAAGLDRNHYPDTPVGDWHDDLVALSEVRFNEFLEPENCADAIGGGYGIDTDLNNDCYLNLLDFSMFTKGWLSCMDPTDNNCDHPWEQ